MVLILWPNHLYYIAKLIKTVGKTPQLKPNSMTREGKNVSMCGK